MNCKPCLKCGRHWFVAAALVFVLLALVASLVPVAAAGQTTEVAAAEPVLHHLYLSLHHGGQVGGVRFAAGDILRYSPTDGWSLYFDASDVGVSDNVLDFEMMDMGSPNGNDNLSILMSFAGRQLVGGVAFRPQDMVRFRPNRMGSLTQGAFDISVRGADYSLTTVGERIDALGETRYHLLAISTTGNALVYGPGRTIIRAAHHDLLGFHPYWHEWSSYLDGAPISGLRSENLGAIWIDQLTNDLYVTIPGSFNLGGVSGNGKDIVRLAWNGDGSYTPSLFWDGSDHGLPNAIDGLEVVLGEPAALGWPIGCIPGQTCVGMGYPDIDSDGKAFNCGQPGYTGHSGTDIGVTWAQMDAGVPVFAAADGTVLWVRDGEYDRCPSPDPECQSDHYYCFGPGSYCGVGTCCCTWCFTGNLIVIRHEGLSDVFATTYGHLREGSLLVQPGDHVTKGQKIAEVGSSGASSGPHVHFDVWGSGFWEAKDPWSGGCGSNFDTWMWEYDPPWAEMSAAAADSPAPVYGPDDVVPRYETPILQTLNTSCPAPDWPAD